MAFRPGQWVDFYAPGLAVVGGYSITSPPSQLRSQRTFDLAVKLSSYAPAVWLHEQARGPSYGPLSLYRCTSLSYADRAEGAPTDGTPLQAAVGDRVQVQVGGSFCLTSQDMQRPLLFIAGGIGITPIAAMLAHLVGEGLPEQAGAREAPPPALLLYSAGTVEELVFRGKLLRLSQESKGEPEPNIQAADSPWLVGIYMPCLRKHEGVTLCQGHAAVRLGTMYVQGHWKCSCMPPRTRSRQCTVSERAASDSKSWQQGCSACQRVGPWCQ